MKGRRRESEYLGMGSIRRFSAVCAGVVVWLFGIYSIYQVARYGLPVCFDPATTCRIMAVRSGEGMHSAVGLTYHGVWGAVLVVGEIVVVAAALVLTRSRASTLRRGALLVVLAWTMLWFANVLWLEQISGWTHPVRLAGVGVATLGAMVVLVLRWRRPTAVRGAD